MSSQTTGEANQPRIYHVIVAFAGHQRIEADSHDLGDEDEKLTLFLNGNIVAEFQRAKVESWWHE